MPSSRLPGQCLCERGVQEERGLLLPLLWVILLPLLVSPELLLACHSDPGSPGFPSCPVGSAGSAGEEILAIGTPLQIVSSPCG